GTYRVALLGNVRSDKFNGDKAKVTTDLTIKGITKPITFEVIKKGNVYTSTITVDRTQYNIRYGSGKFFEGLGDKMIYDEFTIEVKLVVK
ncbi:MAG: YceI family protein, partial [Tenuifilum sp.]